MGQGFAHGCGPPEKGWFEAAASTSAGPGAAKQSNSGFAAGKRSGYELSPPPLGIVQVGASGAGVAGAGAGAGFGAAFLVTGVGAGAAFGAAFRAAGLRAATFFFGALFF